ncbi:MAG: DNA primase [Candidatus Pacebacteria bacterium]|nr:DNA primase [Candidatus Paceibacterota bacterium]
MSLYTDQKYVGLISPRLDLFKQVRPNLWNSRCPICGDSHKNKSKKRMYIYAKKQDLFVKCHNCGYGASLGNFIKQLDPHLHGQYVMERYGQGQTGRGKTKEPEFHFEKPKFKPRPQKIELPSIGELDEEHFARKYFESRKLPESFKDKVYFAEDFKKWAEDISNIDYSNLGKEEPRMVIPFFDTEGKLIAAQGRALGRNELRYITIKVDEDSPKIYGLDRLTPETTTYIVEGPIDSMFLPNCLAVAGGDLQSIKIDKKQCVLIFDNEPRNEHTVKKLMKSIDDGWEVVIWSKGKKFKDINDLIMSGLSTDEILEMINKTTMKGLRADWAAREWRNVQ